MARNRYFVSAAFYASLNDKPHTASRRSLLSAVRSSSSRRLERSSARRVLRYHTLTQSSMSSTTGQPRNRRCIRVSQQRKTKLRWPENSIDHHVHRRCSSSSSASICIRVYKSEADFHKPGIYGGRVRLWADEWVVFHCTPSRGGRCRRAAEDIFRGVFFYCLVGFRFLFLSFS